MNITSYILEQGLILIPVLYILGMMLKGAEKIPDKYIPLILLPMGIAGSVGIMGISFPSVVQGVLITGTCVYGNQVVKQLAKQA